MGRFSALDIERQNARKELVATADMLGAEEWWPGDGDIHTDADRAAKSIVTTAADIHAFFFADGSARPHLYCEDQREREAVIELPAPLGEQLQKGFWQVTV
jgi:hypothetical protein